MDMIKNLAVGAVLAWIAWYGYSQLQPAPTVADRLVEGSSFNCRQALNRLAEEYACRDSGSCSMSSDELDDLRQRELNIEKYCN